MTEYHPTDEDLYLLSATAGAKTSIPHLSAAEEPHYHNLLRRSAWLDRALAILNACRVYRDASAGSASLTFGVTAGDVVISGALIEYAGTDGETLTNNTTNYLYLDSAGTLTVNTTGFPSLSTPHMRLATILTAAGDWDLQDDLTDCRDTALWSAVGGLSRAMLAEEALARYPVDLYVNHGDFARSEGGWGSGDLTLVGSTIRNGTIVNLLTALVPIPPEYVADHDVKLVVHAKVNDAGGGTLGTCEVDAEVYELTDEGAAGADLCATAAQAMTNAFGDKTFTITDTGLVAGDRLLVLVKTSVEENADAGDLNAVIGTVEMQLDIKG